MTHIFTGYRPQLLATLEDIRYLPNGAYHVQEKLDGVRAIYWQGKFYSRRLLPLPNRHLQTIAKLIQDSVPQESLLLDCELYIPRPQSFNITQGLVMSIRSTLPEDLHIVAFDGFGMYGIESSHTYKDRLTMLYGVCDLVSLPQRLFHTSSFEETSDLGKQLTHTYISGELPNMEGIVFRNINKPYKFGRCTEREANAFKYKLWQDDEGTLVEIHPEWHNANEAETDEMGNTKRSTAQAGMYTLPRCGAITLETKYGKIRLSGFTAKMKDYLWENRTQLEKAGKQVKYRYKTLTPNSVPLFPSFISFRED